MVLRRKGFCIERQEILDETIEQAEEEYKD